MGKTKKERSILMSQLYNYRKRISPFDIPFINNNLPQVWWSSVEDFFDKGDDHICQLAMKLFAITPHAAGCERIWSRLGWYYGKRRINLSLGKLENMQKLSAFYLSNIKKELPYYGNSKTTEELQKIIYDAELFDNETDEINESEDHENINFEEENRLEIENLVNLDAEVFATNNVFVYIDNNNFTGINESNESNEDNSNIDYENWDPNEAVNQYLDE